MERRLLNLSRRIDQDTVELLSIVDQVTNNIGLPYLIVGATARDIVMHYGYGARIQRATKDLDFAIQVTSWDAFATIKEKLTRLGFRKGRSPQRMISPKDRPIDLIPFGAIADKDSNIQWPPSGEPEMDVTGFNEAYISAVQVAIQQDPLIQVPVASPQGLALLKLIAWDDRDRDLRAKDAKDIAYLLETYQSVDQVNDRTYGIDGLMEQYDWEIDLASAHLLGIDVAEISGRKSKSKVIEILKKNFQVGQPNRLVEEMCSRIDGEYDARLNQLGAFSNGFQN